MKKLHVKTGIPYDILLERGLLERCGVESRAACPDAERAVIITDSNVAPLYLKKVADSMKSAGFIVYTYSFPAGEQSKTPDSVLKMVSFMADKGLTRQDIAVALGGGVCGDMAGFAAAIYMRGIRFIQIPTSLLAQVDSSVGGKTGVDLPRGKNLCGSFHQPALVLIDPLVLETLDRRYFADGMAEVIKYGCIRDAALFARLEREDIRTCLDDIILRSLEIKRDVVERDEREAGERALLNFGHTIGHAIENYYNYAVRSHGEAVGIGMVMVTQYAESRGMTAPGCTGRIRAVLEKFSLPVSDEAPAEELEAAMWRDKKRTGQAIRFVLLRDIGDGFLRELDADAVKEMLR